MPIETSEGVTVREGIARDRVLGTREDDSYAGTDKNEFVILDQGDDVAETRGGNDHVRSGAGSDRVDTGDGDDTIIETRSTIRPEDNHEVDSFTMGEGNDRARLFDGGTNILDMGNGDDDVRIRNGLNFVDLGDGADKVRVGDGNHFVSMGEDNDSDTFSFSKNDDFTANVRDFDVENDVIDVLGRFDLEAFQENATQAGDNVVYEYEDITLVLHNVDLSSMTEDNFM